MLLLCFGFKSILKVSVAFAVFHGSLGAFVVCPAVPFCRSGGCHLGDDIFYGVSRGFHSTGTGHIPDGAKPHCLLYGFLIISPRDKGGVR
jgi:hypothetical protein